MTWNAWLARGRCGGETNDRGDRRLGSKSVRLSSLIPRIAIWLRKSGRATRLSQCNDRMRYDIGVTEHESDPDYWKEQRWDLMTRHLIFPPH